MALSTFKLALQHHQGGNLQQAEQLYRQVLQIDSRHVDALHLLGVTAYQLGKYDLAVDFIRQAIRLHPEFPAAYNNLGLALTDQGKLDEAVLSYREAVRLRPNYAEAYNNLGNTQRIQGKLVESIASTQQALHLKPNFAEARNNLGNALKDQGKVDEAIINYQQALRLKPDYAVAHYNLGKALHDQGKLDEAIASYRQTLYLKQNHADAHSNLGAALTELGRFDEAGASFREAIRLQPKHAEALGQLASLLRGKLPEADRAVLEQRLAEADLSEFNRVKLLFGLAEVCDAKGEYPRAAAFLRQANALHQSLRRQKGEIYHLDENSGFVDNLMVTFTPAFFERMRGYGLETERPVFIIGLPRSGTTMTEQILAAHSQVYGAGELKLARSDFEALGTQPTDASAFSVIPDLPGDAIQRLAQKHLDQLGAINGTAARIVDKMPTNYCYLGLLAAMFPKAKFIHCRRDLRDVAVSCWTTPFVRWSNDPERIVARFRDYQQLMEHWRKVLPVSVLEVHYEETVTDLLGVARRLVEWCGLDWEPECVKFNEGHRPVRTPSKLQVREPVFTRSVGRWRNYETELSDLFAALKAL